MNGQNCGGLTGDTGLIEGEKDRTEGGGGLLVGGSAYRWRKRCRRQRTGRTIDESGW